MSKVLKVLGWICCFITVFGGIGSLMHDKFQDKYNFLGWLIWLALTLLFFWGSKKLKKNVEENDSHNDDASSTAAHQTQTAETNSRKLMMSESELNGLIQNCDDLGQMFIDSPALKSTGNGRTEKMFETMMSYKCIFIYFFSEVFYYGKSIDFLADEKLKSRYLLSYNLVFTDKNAMKQCLAQLPTNWNDIITVINNLELAGERETIAKYETAVANLTTAFKNISTYEL